MFNMLCMDLRRLFRSRSFYIILGATAALILLVVLLTAVVSDPETLDDMHASGAEIEEIDRRISEEIRSMTQLDLTHETLGSGFLLVIAGIGMTLFAGGDFSSGYIKNICFCPPPALGLRALQAPACRRLQRPAHSSGRSAVTAESAPGGAASCGRPLVPADGVRCADVAPLLGLLSDGPDAGPADAE